MLTPRASEATEKVEQPYVRDTCMGQQWTKDSCLQKTLKNLAPTELKISADGIKEDMEEHVIKYSKQWWKAEVTEFMTD